MNKDELYEIIIKLENKIIDFEDKIKKLEKENEKIKKELIFKNVLLDEEEKKKINDKPRNKIFSHGLNTSQDSFLKSKKLLDYCWSQMNTDY
jgi:hypothetical protein